LKILPQQWRQRVGVSTLRPLTQAGVLILMTGYGAYQAAQRTSTNPIQLEADLMGRITREIETYRKKGGPEYVKALYRNVQLWNAFSADLLSDDNKLPDQLKASLISLSIWVEKHTDQVVNKRASVDALIDVNRSIIAGLFEAHKAQMKQSSSQANPGAGAALSAGPPQFQARSA
jgi:flagellar protein FlaF